MNLLTVVLALPLAGFLIALLLPRSSPQASRMWALVSSLATFAASLGLLAWFDRGSSAEQFLVDVPWIASPNIHFAISANGISLWLVILSTFLTPLCVLISWNSIQVRVKEFFAFLLLLEFGLIGVFIAQDLFLFFVFWEVSLVPMYFLIGIWGHERRIYAAVKFFLYTMAGSVLMLTAIIYLYNRTGTFSYPAILEMLLSGQLRLAPVEQMLLFLAFFVAFAIKVPLFPLHTWLPDAHVEAPTAGSVMLASVMLKMGSYGILHFCLPLFPAAARTCAPWIVVAGHHRDHLRRAGGHGAAQSEEAGGLLFGEPFGLRGARHFHVHADGPGRRGLPDAESRHLHGRAVHRRRSAVRAPAFPRNQRFRRRGHGRALAFDRVPDHHAGQYRAADAEQFRRRIPGAAGSGRRQIIRGPSTHPSA